MQWLQINHIGDLASVGGVLISIVGFIVTLLSVQRAKQAADQAAESARQAKEKLKLFDSIAGIGEALAIVDEIKRHQRSNSIHLIPDRCTALKRILISIKANNIDLTGEHVRRIQSSITTFGTIEKMIDDCLINQKTTNLARLNRLLSEEADGLVGILSDLKLSPDGGKR